MKPENRNPIFEEELNLPETKGFYKLFCKSVLKLWVVALSILNTVKTAFDTLKASDYKKLVSCLWIVVHNANKLEGICSISSSVHDNCFCKAWRKIKDCICSHCYAHNQQSYQTGLKEHNILNGIILRNILIPVKFFKALMIIYPYLRIESFGDVANVIQARNYIRIIKAFPKKRCAIWTKNYNVWYQAFEIEGKPENTTFVVSSPYMNKPASIPENLKKYVDHIFTVYDKKYAKEHNIEINCGGRKCLECIRKHTNCYYRNTVYFINELLK